MSCLFCIADATAVNWRKRAIVFILTGWATNEKGRRGVLNLCVHNRLCWREVFRFGLELLVMVQAIYLLVKSLAPLQNPTTIVPLASTCVVRLSCSGVYGVSQSILMIQKE
jgi:hypothetical protein